MLLGLLLHLLLLLQLLLKFQWILQTCLDLTHTQLYHLLDAGFDSFTFGI